MPGYMTDTRDKPLSAVAPGRWLLFALGWVCVGLGIIGIFTPMMPGTVFLIIAAWLFSRSSPRFEAWLLGHPRLGPAVVAWRANGAIPRSAQYFSAASMVFSFGVLVLMGMSLPLLVLTGLFFIAVAAFILTRPTG